MRDASVRVADERAVDARGDRVRAVVGDLAEGDPAPVRLACLPSMPSIVWYTKSIAAHATAAHAGRLPSRSGLCHRSVPYAPSAKTSPTVVIRLGANQVGKNRTPKFQNLWRNSFSSTESSGEVYLYDRTCAHRVALARGCGRPGGSPQHSEHL